MSSTDKFPTERAIPGADSFFESILSARKALDAAEKSFILATSPKAVARRTKLPMMQPGDMEKIRRLCGDEIADRVDLNLSIAVSNLWAADNE